MTTPGGPYFYDPRVNDWTFDTSSLRNLDVGHLAGVLVQHFRGRAHLVPEVTAELPATSVLRSPLFPWFDVQPIALPAQQQIYALLRQRWSMIPGRDQGEAAAVVLAGTRGYRFLCDDHIGFRAAESEAARVCAMHTPDFVVASVRAGWITPVDGWKAIEEMANAGRWLNIPWQSRAEYDALCAVQGFDDCRFDSAATLPTGGARAATATAEGTGASGGQIGSEDEH